MRKLLYANYIPIICLFIMQLLTTGCCNDKVIKGLNIQGSVYFYENSQKEINITITDLATEKQFKRTTDSSGQFS